MKKLFITLFFLMAFAVFGQEKYALIIGNANYRNFGTLRNPINDATDMKDMLEKLEFNVDIVLDGSLGQMENAAMRLRNNLSLAGNDSIGFFYYAGHGLETGGVNYLIPADANIPDRLFLRERAFSVQIMLDLLNDSRNSLNIVVLDACRDFPASWSRSMSRGLAIISNPPANHIIMYSTGAGQIANDGTGRNGFFTNHFLNNLGQPMEINEIFRRTMSDVARASNNEQRPALYTDFGETVYFTLPPEPEPPPEPEVKVVEQIVYIQQPSPQPFYPEKPIEPEPSPFSVKFSFGLVLGVAIENLEWYYWNNDRYDHTFTGTEVTINYLSPTINLRFLYSFKNGLNLGLGADATIAFFGSNLLLYNPEPNAITGGTGAPYAIVGYKDSNLHLGYDFVWGGMYISPNYAINRHLLIGLPMTFFGSNQRGLCSLFNPSKGKVEPPERYSNRKSSHIGLSVQFVI